MDRRDSNDTNPDTSTEEDGNEEDDTGRTPIARPSPKRPAPRNARQSAGRTRMETRLHKHSYESRVLRRRSHTSPTTSCVAMSFGDHHN